MARKTVTKYMVITSEGKIVQRGFNTWEDAYNWAVIHDWGQYGSRLHPAPYTTAG